MIGPFISHIEAKRQRK